MGATLRRKMTILAFVSALLLGLLAGCTGGGSKSGESGELVIWWADWGESYNKIFDDAVYKFFAPKVPDLKVTISHMKVDEKLLPAVASGKVPDLTYLNSGFAVPYALNGALQPLDDFMKTNHFDSAKDFSADVNASYTWDGKLYGIGLAADSPAIFYNKAAFREAGLDPEKPPRTLDDLSRANQKLLRKNASGGIERIGLNPLNIYVSSYAVGVAMGSEFYDAASKKAIVNNPKLVQAYEWIRNEVKAIGIDELDKMASAKASGNNDPFYTGKTAMVVDGFWRLLDAKQFAPNLDYGVVPLPKSFAGVSWGIGIPKGAKNKKAAELFLQWLLTDKVAGTFMAEGTNPFNFKLSLDTWFKAVESMSKGTPNEKYMSVWKEVFENSTINTYKSPAPAAYDQWLQQALDAVVHDKKKPQEALDEANKQIQLEIDKALSAAKSK
ncbi:extracellular solute-binding protein [Paenibacillus ginsengarvi]|uniref:Extracellular solute-binding protein n=1 Tax=Paenibacillus ginsengarvi TaxID=400777 RepID=A0A3B0CL65_9BACL|nr:extracellular solute-binding protein [Paenibacillus ginsengarvi]RKN85488.1 extracellular solute-binding protein [Paenibacillus ginsengarvi]